MNECQTKHDILSVSGLLDMLSRAQCSRVDDQRGLLTKEQLEIPQFLQLPPDQGQEAQPDRSSTTKPSTEDSKEKSEDKTSSTSSSAGAQPKDLRETTL